MAQTMMYKDFWGAEVPVQRNWFYTYQVPVQRTKGQTGSKQGFYRERLKGRSLKKEEEGYSFQKDKPPI